MGGPFLAQRAAPLAMLSLLPSSRSLQCTTGMFKPNNYSGARFCKAQMVYARVDSARPVADQ